MSVAFMDVRCPRCGTAADMAGHEDARAFYECRNCNRVWATELTSLALSDRTPHGRDMVRILVVDDSDELLMLIAAWLEDEGYSVVTARTGREALDAAAVYYPDIVVTDVVMPPPDGFDLAEALVSNLTPQVIMMTGVSNPFYLRRAADLGVVSLLRKPFVREALLEAISVASERSRRDPLARLRWHFGMHPRCI